MWRKLTAFVDDLSTMVYVGPLVYQPYLLDEITHQKQGALEQMSRYQDMKQASKLGAQEDYAGYNKEATATRLDVTSVSSGINMIAQNGPAVVALVERLENLLNRLKPSKSSGSAQNAEPMPSYPGPALIAIAGAQNFMIQRAIDLVSEIDGAI